MKKIELFNLKGEKVNDIKLNEEIFGITPNKAVLNDAIILTMASLRQGTHKTKKSFWSIWWWKKAMETKRNRTCPSRIY